MATGTTPSAAEEALGTTDKKANFQRLTRLLMRGGLTLLREVFDAIHPPANLPAVLGDPFIKPRLHQLKQKKVLTQPEYDCLYSPPSGAYGKSTDFDISLLCKLLRAICSLTPPITGWNNLPNSTDHSLEADLVRIRIYRNSIYGHNHSMEITDADFGKLWTEISEALLRIAGGISSAKKDEWKKAIENFFHDPLTPDAKECIDELRLWYLMDMDTKEKLEKLSVKVEQGHQNLGGMMERLQIKQEQLEQKLMDIHIVVKHLEASGSFVNGSGKLHIATQVEGAQLSTDNIETRIPIPIDPPPLEGTACPSTSTELQASEQNLPAVFDFWHVVYSFKRPLELLIKYLKIKLGVNVESYGLGSLIIAVSCSSLEALEAFWNEYRTGRLNEVVQDMLVTAEVLEKLELSEVKLRTIISEEDYLSYKDFLKNRSGEEEGTTPIPQVLESAATLLDQGKGRMKIPQVQGSLAVDLVEATPEKVLGTHSWETTPISRSFLRDLAEDLGTKWRELGKTLGLVNSLLNYFDMEYLTLSDKGNAMLYEWKRLNGDDATMDILEEALKKIDMGHLMKKVADTTLSTTSRIEATLHEFCASEEEGTTPIPQVLESAVTLLDQGKGRMKIPQVQGSLVVDLVEDTTLSTTSRIEATLHEFCARPTHGKPSQVVQGGYIARSGYVLIINNHPIATEHTEKSVFAQTFGFTTREDIYLTTSDMLKALTDTAQRDFSNNDCFCCIIRSTGTEHGICGTDDKPIDIKTITSLFTRDKCPSLDGKPKIFVLIPKKFEYQTDVFSLLYGRSTHFLPPADIEARSMLQHLVISEKDFVVWNRFGEVPSSHHYMYMRSTFRPDWLMGLSSGMHLRRAIEVATDGNEEPLSLLSTLEKDVFFEQNDSLYTVA